jgi:hypothetical protein
MGWQDAMEEFSQYGEIARLDVSLSASSGSVLVTFYDVRVTTRLIQERPDQAALFPGQPHDFRSVKLNMASLVQHIGALGDFGCFGEVANCSVECGDVVIEFFDMRAAQGLLAAVGSSGSPWPAMNQDPVPPPPPPPLQSPLSEAGSPLAAYAMQGTAPTLTPSPFFPSALPFPPGIDVPMQAPTDLDFDSKLAGLAQALKDLQPAGNEQKKAEKDASPTNSSPTHSPKKSPVRTKVTNKEFAKFDIEPEKILSGEDTRTTVMVRNLTGNNARQDFLNFLAIAGLSDRYTFFYMPYKQTRDVLAGFAFVNFVAPQDVQVLHAKIKQGLGRNGNRDSNVRPLAISYARFQGHEQLVKHFSSSAVLHEQDPEKRPIFRAKGVQKQRQEDPKPKKGERKASLKSDYAEPQPAFIPLPEYVLDGHKGWFPDMMSHSAIVGA